MIIVTHRANALHVEHVEGDDVCLIDMVPLAPGDDVAAAIADLSATYADEQD